MTGLSQRHFFFPSVALCNGLNIADHCKVLIIIIAESEA